MTGQIVMDDSVAGAGAAAFASRCVQRASVGARVFSAAVVLSGSLALAGCGSGGAQVSAQGSLGVEQPAARKIVVKEGFCKSDSADLDFLEYDTSGDMVPDVRKVFRKVGELPLVRLVLVCRESDLNADGTKDVVRYYDEEGRPRREQADRDFDGQLDEVSYFQEGRLVRQEFDHSRDGKIDTKLFYAEGVAMRLERDLGGRSTPTKWMPDRWEYIEDGHVVRMGTDLDGDGRVDRWDRDAERAPKPEEEGDALPEGDAADGEAADGEAADGEAADGEAGGASADDEGTDQPAGGA